MTIEDKIREIVRPSIHNMNSYHVQDAEGMIKLDAMENPYPLPVSIRKDWLKNLSEAEINRYPNPDGAELKGKIRKTFNVPDNTAVILGNGSDELIQLFVMAVASKGTVIAAPEPSFVMYRAVADMLDVHYHGIGLHPHDFSLNMDLVAETIKNYNPAIIFIAWPNNPTGNLFADNDIEYIIEESGGIVVIDEAYHAFAERSFMSHLERYENLVVMRTLSKLGLAGLRLGFAVGAPAVINQIEKIRMPYNVSVLTQKSAACILDHIELLDEQAAKITAARKEQYKLMSAISGIKVWDSATNFLLFKTENKPAVEVHASLRHQGILIKQLDGSHPALEDCLRVTIGTGEENSLFISALEKSVL